NFALDPTVILHETGHAIILRQVAVGGGVLNRSLNEGVADYWSYAFHGNDTVGTWALGPPGEGGLARQANAVDVFPEHIRAVNEIHAHGQILAWALFSTRRELAARNPSGAFLADLYAMKTLRTVGVGMTDNQDERSIHAAFLRVMAGMLAQAGSTADAPDILA